MVDGSSDISQGGGDGKGNTSAKGCCSRRVCRAGNLG